MSVWVSGLPLSGLHEFLLHVCGHDPCKYDNKIIMIIIDNDHAFSRRWVMAMLFCSLTDVGVSMAGPLGMIWKYANDISGSTRGGSHEADSLELVVCAMWITSQAHVLLTVSTFWHFPAFVRLSYT